jgi:predicted MarR family transcription regulator
MTYDLRRLRLHGLIERLPHTSTYVPTHDGIRVALFYTKVHERLMIPLLAADHPPAPAELRRAIRVVDGFVEDHVIIARIKEAA